MPNHLAKRAALIARCNAAPKARDGEFPAVMVEEFFDGNDDLGSILCNADPHPGLAAVRNALLAVSSRPEVEAVMIRIQETMEDDDEAWPYAEQALIVTDADPDEVRSWFDEALAPADVWELEDRVEGLPAPRAAGARTLVAWWD